jgi:hypothetical protein
MKPLTTLGQLEAWFASSHLNPSPTSRIAELMRELLEKNPDLSFEQLHQLARTGNAEGGSQGKAPMHQERAVLRWRAKV